MQRAAPKLVLLYQPIDSDAMFWDASQVHYWYHCKPLILRFASHAQLCISWAEGQAHVDQYCPAAADMLKHGQIVCRAALNDSYRTDVCLTHTPQTIALACVMLVGLPHCMYFNLQIQPLSPLHILNLVLACLRGTGNRFWLQVHMERAHA